VTSLEKVWEQSPALSQSDMSFGIAETEGSYSFGHNMKVASIHGSRFGGELNLERERILEEEIWDHSLCYKLLL
jgi:hypothetical protein